MIARTSHFAGLESCRPPSDGAEQPEVVDNDSNKEVGPVPDEPWTGKPGPGAAGSGRLALHRVQVQFIRLLLATSLQSHSRETLNTLKRAASPEGISCSRRESGATLNCVINCQTACASQRTA